MYSHYISQIGNLNVPTLRQEFGKKALICREIYLWDRFFHIFKFVCLINLTKTNKTNLDIITFDFRGAWYYVKVKKWNPSTSFHGLWLYRLSKILTLYYTLLIRAFRPRVNGETIFLIIYYIITVSHLPARLWYLVTSNFVISTSIYIYFVLRKNS